MRYVSVEILVLSGLLIISSSACGGIPTTTTSFDTNHQFMLTAADNDVWVPFVDPNIPRSLGGIAEMSIGDEINIEFSGTFSRDYLAERKFQVRIGSTAVAELNGINSAAAYFGSGTRKTYQANVKLVLSAQQTPTNWSFVLASGTWMYEEPNHSNHKQYSWYNTNQAIFLDPTASTVVTPEIKFYLAGDQVIYFTNTAFTVQVRSNNWVIEEPEPEPEYIKTTKEVSFSPSSACSNIPSSSTLVLERTEIGQVFITIPPIWCGVSLGLSSMTFSASDPSDLLDSTFCPSSTVTQDITVFRGSVPDIGIVTITTDCAITISFSASVSLLSQVGTYSSSIISFQV